MTSKLNNLFGQISSYATSLGIISFNPADIANWLIAAIPALAGAFLTYQIGRIRKAEADKLEIDNTERRKELQEQEDNTDISLV